MNIEQLKMLLKIDKVGLSLNLEAFRSVLGRLPKGVKSYTRTTSKLNFIFKTAHNLPLKILNNKCNISGDTNADTTPVEATRAVFCLWRIIKEI